MTAKAAKTTQSDVLIKVINKQTGVKSVGDYKVGTVYSVSPEEAERLTTHKGFVLAVEADEVKKPEVTQEQ